MLTFSAPLRQQLTERTAAVRTGQRSGSKDGAGELAERSRSLEAASMPERRSDLVSSVNMSKNRSGGGRRASRVRCHVAVQFGRAPLISEYLRQANQATDALVGGARGWGRCWGRGREILGRWFVKRG